MLLCRFYKQMHAARAFSLFDKAIFLNASRIFLYSSFTGEATLCLWFTALAQLSACFSLFFYSLVTNLKIISRSQHHVKIRLRVQYDLLVRLENKGKNITTPWYELIFYLSTTFTATSKYALHKWSCLLL